MMFIYVCKMNYTRNIRFPKHNHDVIKTQGLIILWLLDVAVTV